MPPSSCSLSARPRVSTVSHSMMHRLRPSPRSAGASMEFRSPSNLAAARVEFFGVAALASRLDNMFAVLTQGRRFALPRHQTLRATLDWGYNLLSPTEQTVLRRIAIFRATFTLDSALAVVVGPAISVENAIDAMANLVAKSLLSADEHGRHRAVSVAGGDPPVRHRKARGQRRGAADRTAARRTPFDLDRDRATQLAIRCRETMVAASCRTDRRLSGGARLVVLASWRSVDRSPSDGKFDTAVAAVVADPGVCCKDRTSVCSVWRNCRSRTPSWKCGCGPRSVTRSGIRRAGGTAWRPRSRARWNWPIRSGTCPPGCTRGGACGRYGVPAASIGRRWHSRTITWPWPGQRVIRRMSCLATGSLD